MKQEKLKNCTHCGKEIAASAKVCPHCGGKNKPPVYKRWWFIVLMVLILFSFFNPGESTSSSSVSSSSVSKSAASSTALSAEDRFDQKYNEEEFKAACQQANYKDLCRNPDEHKGDKVKLTVKVSQILGDDWHAYTDNEGYEIYFDDEYYLTDMRRPGSMKVLKDDILTVYGEFEGMVEVTRALTGTEEEVPCINVIFADLVKE